MEKIGQVNEYVARNERGGPTHIFHTILLAAGTTPFLQSFACADRFTKVQAQSNFYRLTVKVATVSHAFYRPGKLAWDVLDEDARGHVLKGGLLCDTFVSACRKQARGDTLRDGFGYDDFKAFCAAEYGVEPPVWSLGG